MTDVREIRHFHLFCGLGGGAAGFNRGSARVGNMVARFRCIGGVDVDPAGIRDFGRLAGVPGTVIDLFDRDQYRAFHGREPGPDWREATPADIANAAGGERPHIVFLSAPCKGFSGLLNEAASKTAKYQALNRLTLRGIFLTLEAWAGDPPELVIFENVPRIASRGRKLLDAIGDLLRAYGYSVAETTHDCGELGGLAQSRKRFLLVARHRAKVPPYLYEPVRLPLRGVGEVLGRLPLPGDPAGGAMHRVPSLQWRTWVRLAFVEAGKDWRSLNGLRVGDDGNLLDFGIAPAWHRGVLGVTGWDDVAATVSSNGRPGAGRYAVADPRSARELAGNAQGGYDVTRWSDPGGAVSSGHSPSNNGGSVADPRRDAGRAEFGQYGVQRWGDAAYAVSGKAAAGSGSYSVADPRHAGPAKHYNEFRIVPWAGQTGAVSSAHGSGQCVSDPRAPDGSRGEGKYRVTAFAEPGGSVIAASTTGNGAFAVADPRYAEGAMGQHTSKMRVHAYDAPAGTVTGSDRVGSGAMSVADPRCGLAADRAGYTTQGHYGVSAWDEPSSAVPGFAKHDRGRWSVADPRDGAAVDAAAGLPAPSDRLVCRIEARDCTWHRPFTTLELAALQSLFDPEEAFGLDGQSDSAWRERIGNAVPRDAAAAIASTMGRTLLLAWSGESFLLSNDPVWVRPLTIALAVETPEIRV
ncbi:MAG: DNA cytosine methyltransferase [Sphingomonadaceae bacterium]|nr:DNA cytosine methyltransferase [Sphingomonadaceae bacterium]